MGSRIGVLLGDLDIHALTTARSGHPGMCGHQPESRMFLTEISQALQESGGSLRALLRTVVFDVNDMMTNTTGAVLSSIFALAIPLRWLPRDGDMPADEPRPIHKGRRLLAMVSDFVAFSIVAAGITVVLRTIFLSLLDRPDLVVDSALTQHFGVGGGPSVLDRPGRVIRPNRGRYCGGTAICGRYIARIHRANTAVSWGIGLYGALLFLPDDYQYLATLFALSALACALFTRHGRGLPGLISGQTLEDDRE